MSVKHRVVRAVIKWLVKRYPYQVKDVLLGENTHIHKNPVRRQKLILVDEPTGKEGRHDTDIVAAG